MAPYLLLVLHTLFFLTGLSGIHGVSTVSHVSVREGGSITIPCLYHHGSEKHVKYWCSGYFFNFCSTLIRTDSQSASNGLSIADHVTTRVFTVTMKNLQLGVSGYFWCAVEKGDTTYLYLSVATGTAGLYVDQQHVAGVEGQSVTVNCNYHNSGDFCWCRLGGSCVEKSVGNLDGASVELKRILANGKKVMIVTMSQLTIKNTGWYWCAVGDLQMPVHITVNQPTTTQSNTTTTNQNNGGTDEKRQERTQSLLVVLLIPLSLLVVVIAVTLLTWKMLRKHEYKKAKDQPTNTSVQSADPEQNITYSTVSHIRGSTQQGLNSESHGDLYSTVIPKQHRTAQRAAEPDVVVYSTVA
ncbi:polymeric immunoglobulin receptor-like isoform X1 [Salvelinus fontinalis]|uniref:polymeric immunoglobulin receptor-like isoform X1 n=2 Tax=Salvelinus fontinalis TaxID=8038 RepID=UPI00248578CA|nr:polymeric immunoglobulin receptor-like isoform X1 [Salvelinus fontinalis]XP_055758351.1 polymeric immunoglobulin receptor-like isoform X1 [Salvelinus fontinalis]XP_055758352.1 polymeric immunoglobulin receptor-like isoform X1 [Salvelinus fontinalis]